MASSEMVRVGRIQDFTRQLLQRQEFLKAQLENNDLHVSRGFLEGQISALDLVIKEMGSHFGLSSEERTEERQPAKKKVTIKKLRADGLHDIADFLETWRNRNGTHWGWDAAFVARVGEQMARKYDIHTVPVGKLRKK